MDTTNNICPQCSKEVKTATSGGSLTSFIFADLYCACANGKPDAVDVLSTDARCPDCGLVIARRAASLTSFLFQDVTCQCRRGPSKNTPARIGDLKMQRLEPRHSILETRFSIEAHPRGSDARSRFQKEKEEASEGKVKLTPADLEIFGKFKTGELVGGSYKIIAPIGKGGMGLVFLAEYMPLKRRCAIKFLTPYAMSDSNFQLLQKEAKILAGMSHPMVCQIYDFGIHENRLPFYAMEHLAGQSLEALLAQKKTLSVGAALEIFKKTGEGLAYAHSQGVVHKDIKPANIMIVPLQSGEVSVKILDFGIAELLHPETGKLSNVKKEKIAGTTYYMSPEQFDGENIDQTSDIYALGCTIFETLAGEPPYLGDNALELQRKHQKADIPSLYEKTGVKFPPALEAILRKTLAKSPAQRYRSAADLVDDLELFSADQTPEHAIAELKFFRASEQEAVIENAEPVPEATSQATEPRHSISVRGHWAVIAVLIAFSTIIVLGYVAVVSYVDWTTKNAQDRKARANLQNVHPAGKPVKIKQSYASLIGEAIKSNKEERFADCVKYASAAIKLGAVDGQPYILRGIGYCGMERNTESLRDLQKAIAMTPSLNTVQLDELFLRNYVELKMWEKALEKVDSCIKAFPTVEHYRRKGQILSELNRFDEAIKNFNTAIAMKPNEYWLHYDRGSCYATSGKHAEAIKDFTKDIEMRPLEPSAYKARAKSYRALGKIEEAKLDEKKNSEIGAESWDYLKPDYPLQ